MNQIELQESGIKALRAFNGAIATGRLYPATAPQVTKAIEHGFKKVHQFLDQHGNLDISLRDGEPFLCNLPVGQETLASFPNLIVYRQMGLLGVTRLLIQQSMDMFAFGQILSVFNATADRIAKVGGGIEYITGLGLISYFPESDHLDASAGAVAPEQVSSPKKGVKVEPELLAFLFGKDNRSVAREKTKKSFVNVDKTVEIMAAAIGHILRDLQKRNVMDPSELFSHLLTSSGELIAADDHLPVALELARVLVKTLKEPTLCVILCQDYPAEFGKQVFEAQITLIDTHVFGNIIILLREQLAKTRVREGPDSPRVKFAEKALLRLLATKKGKHFLGIEKARMVLQKGEESRKKQRIEAGIRGVAQGDFTYLQSAEFLEHLPDAIRKMVGAGDDFNLNVLLQKLANQVHTSRAGSPLQFLTMLIAVAENFVVDRHWYYLDMLLPSLLEWVRITEESDEPFEKVVTLLQTAMQHYWKIGKKSQGDAVLTLFHQIRTGELKKRYEIETIVGRVQDRGIQRTGFPELLNKWLLEPHNEEASNRLIMQGPVALRFLVESLIMDQNSDNRFRILSLLASNDRFVPEIICERLHERMPWYGNRNLLKLLEQTGGEEDAENALPHFSHEDFRVQRGAFICVNTIGGKNRKRLFLLALADSSEHIKIQIIGALVRFCDQEVVGHLAKMLEEYETFSETNRDALLVQLFDTLGRCPCPLAVKAVGKFLTMRSHHRIARTVSAQVWAAAEKAMQLLEEDQQQMRKLHKQAARIRKNAIRQAVKKGKKDPSQKSISGLVEEQSIRTLLKKGEEEKARKQLVDLIEQTAQTRNFVQAEKLKEWLIDIDPTALGDIIRAAESISEKKTDTVNKTHVEIWSELYEFLTTEEFNLVYHSLQHKKYVNEETVAHQGGHQTALYFINSGKVKLFFQDRGSRVLVKTMGQGEIVGANALFDASAWTISVASVGSTEMSILRLEKMQQWKEELPGLAAKLRDFCARFENLEDIIKQSSRDRRAHERQRIDGRVTALLLDNEGRPTGVDSKAELVDISEGGVSFQQRVLKKENARLFLGRKVKVMLPGGKKMGQQVGIDGDILAVRETAGRESVYSVHVKFEAAMSNLQLKEIVTAAQRESQVSR